MNSFQKIFLNAVLCAALGGLNLSAGDTRKKHVYDINEKLDIHFMTERLLTVLESYGYNGFDIDSGKKLKEKFLLYYPAEKQLTIEQVDQIIQNILKEKLAQSERAASKNRSIIFLSDIDNVVDIDAALIKAYDYATILTLNLAERTNFLYALGQVEITSVASSTSTTVSPVFSDSKSDSGSDNGFGLAEQYLEQHFDTLGISPRAMSAVPADLTNINVVSLEQELLTHGKAVAGITDIYATAILKNDLAKKIALNHSWREAI